ncbi:hypothetical protein PL321_10055 [Caloramator sp. mosi_1]|nr:hypothetical protein [Caloramator sp. mosi_1]WDC83164.1 hypothetical protein PL321_10055 [Caloramator sp. mosi_1]
MYLKELEPFNNRIISKINIDERPANYVNFPSDLSDELKDF